MTDLFSSVIAAHGGLDLLAHRLFARSMGRFQLLRRGAAWI